MHGAHCTTAPLMANPMPPTGYPQGCASSSRAAGSVVQGPVASSPWPTSAQVVGATPRGHSYLPPSHTTTYYCTSASSVAPPPTQPDPGGSALPPMIGAWPRLVTERQNLPLSGAEHRGCVAPVGVSVEVMPTEALQKPDTTPVFGQSLAADPASVREPPPLSPISVQDSQVAAAFAPPQTPVGGAVEHGGFARAGVVGATAIVEEAEPFDVHTVVKQVCPTCGQAFETLELARTHWLHVHRAPNGVAPAAAAAAGPSSSADVEEDTTERTRQRTAIPAAPDARLSVEGDSPADGSPCIRRRLRHVCPDCSEAFDTLEEAQAHWMERHRQPCPAAVTSTCQPATASNQQETLNCDTAASQPNSPEFSTTLVPGSKGIAKAKLVEAGPDGEPVIARYVDPNTGEQRTTVTNDDGTQRVFGEDTVASMTKKDEHEIEQWLALMTDRDVRGLVHEVNERVVETSTRLHGKREDLELISRRLHLSFFGLPPQPGAVTERDLDNAYRRLARSMHPDKNGGTDDAKHKFQDMKHRYEELKSSLTSAAPSPQDGSAEESECAPPCETGAARGGSEESGGDARGRDDDTGRDEAGRLDGSATAVVGSSGLRQSRADSEQAAWRMLRQLKMIHQNMSIVERDLARVQSELDANEVRRGHSVDGQPGMEDES